MSTLTEIAERIETVELEASDVRKQAGEMKGMNAEKRAALAGRLDADIEAARKAGVAVEVLEMVARLGLNAWKLLT